MRTVAISTIGRCCLLMNYGSFFQHYALRQVLKNLGLRPFRVHSDNEYPSLAVRFKNRLLDILRPYYWFLTRFPERKKYANRLRIGYKIEKKFLKDFNLFIAPFDEAMAFDDLTIGIKGGDQVLNPEEDDLIWLSNVVKHNPKICYAASCDWFSLSGNKKRQQDLRGRLSDFSAIGLREARGVEMVSGILEHKVDVVRVADPVFLLPVTAFRQLESKSKVLKKPTLLCYLVNIRSEKDLDCAELAQLAEALGCELRIIGIQVTEDFAPKGILLKLGPSEFLKAVDEASYFITNSFHGLAFGIIYHRKFLFIPQRNLPGMDQNERQMELLCRYGLVNRIAEGNAPVADLVSIIRAVVDWDAVSEITYDEREFSINWLEKSLGLK